MRNQLPPSSWWERPLAGCLPDQEFVTGPLEDPGLAPPARAVEDESLDFGRLRRGGTAWPMGMLSFRKLTGSWALGKAGPGGPPLPAPRGKSKVRVGENGKPVERFSQQHIPQIRLAPPLWVDCNDVEGLAQFS